MTNDSLYQQLLENPKFVAWAINPSSAENDYWQTWIRQNPEHKEILLQARMTILAIYGKEVAISDEEISQKIQLALAQGKRAELEGNIKPLAARPILYLRQWFVAASMLLVLGLGWAAYQYTSKATAFQSPPESFMDRARSVVLKEVVYTGKSIKHVKLSDGSSVVLFKNSKLTYPETFSENNRIVALSGDAFFEVIKDPSKPFFVYAGGIVTKVLGTSFSIKTGEENSDITVLVKTGKVSVYRESGFSDGQLAARPPAMVLSPNEQAVFEVNGSHLNRTTSNQAGLLEIPIEKEHFEFNHTPITQVFNALEQAYGVTIRFDKKMLANCSITAELGDEPLDTKLEWICSILEASYKIGDQEITVAGKPCE